MLKKFVQQGRRRIETRGVAFLTRPPSSCHCSSVPMGYVEDFDESKTLHGARRVSARLGWVGEKGDFFSILLRIVDSRMDRVADQFVPTLKALELHDKIEPGDLTTQLPNEGHRRGGRASCGQQVVHDQDPFPNTNRIAVNGKRV